jgi:hypothetical protein
MLEFLLSVVVPFILKLVTSWLLEMLHQATQAAA